MSGLLGMAVRRVRKLIAWGIAIAVVGLLALGLWAVIAVL